MGGRKYFFRSLKSPGVVELARQTSFAGELPLTPGIHEAPARSPVGALDPAYMVAREPGSRASALIFLHGNNERPFDLRKRAKNTLSRIFPELRSGAELPCDVLVVRAPFHAGSLRQYGEAMGDLRNFAATVAASAALTEQLVQRLRFDGSGPVLVAGISLGGWSSNLHHAAFATADATAPIFAGAALAETFLTSAYRRLTAAQALAAPEIVRAVLNFEDRFAQVDQRRVHPLLARHDQYIDFQRQSASYVGADIDVIEAGHVTGTLDVARLRAHLLEVMSSA